MVYYFKKQDSFNYAVIRKWFVRIIGVGGVLAFIGGLVVANAEVNPERGVEMDSTLGGLMLLGTIAAIGLLYYLESLNKGTKKTYAGIYIFFVIVSAIFVFFSFNITILLQNRLALMVAATGFVTIGFLWQFWYYFTDGRFQGAGNS
jgi:hypothetical protein